MVKCTLEGGWKLLLDGEAVSRRPYTTVSGIALDAEMRFPIIYRSDKVRSAKNCWSIPSGLHEIGLTMEDQFCTELKEELNLTAYPESARHVGVYENIAACDGYHWVIHIFVVRVADLKCIVNREPDKHPEMRLVHINEFRDDPTLGLEWSPGLAPALRKFHPRILTAATLSHLSSGIARH